MARTQAQRLTKASATTAAPAPRPGEAVVTLGQPTYRSRAATLYIDDPLFKELRGHNAERTLDRMLADPVIGGSILRTSLMLRSASWHIQPGGPDDLDQQFADRLNEDIENLNTGWASTVAQAADMLAYGFSLFETLFRRDADGYHWVDFSPRDQRSVDGWNIDEGTGQVLSVYQRVQPTAVPGPRLVTTPQRMGGRIEIPGWKLLHFRTHPASGRPEGISVVRNAFLPWADKQELRRVVKLGVRRDFTGVAKFEVPARVLSKGATAEEKALVSQAEALVRDFERDEREGIVVPGKTDPATGQPSGYEFGLVQSTGRRQLGLEELWGIHNREIAFGLLTEFMLLGHEQTGTQALGVGKMDFFARAITALLDVIAEVMEHKAVPVYQALNPGFAAARRPTFVHGDVDKQSLSDVATFIQATASSGAIIPDPALDQWLRELVGAPTTASLDTEL